MDRTGDGREEGDREQWLRQIGTICVEKRVLIYERWGESQR